MAKNVIFYTVYFENSQSKMLKAGKVRVSSDFGCEKEQRSPLGIPPEIVNSGSLADSGPQPLMGKGLTCKFREFLP